MGLGWMAVGGMERDEWMHDGMDGYLEWTTPEILRRNSR